MKTFPKIISVQANAGIASVKPRSGGRSQNDLRFLKQFA